MEKFGFVFHPLSTDDYQRRYPILKHIPGSWIEGFAKNLPAMRISDITGVRSDHAEIKGVFASIPLTSRQMLALPEKFVLDKLIQAGKICQKEGAKIIGLGAFASVVGDKGYTIDKALDIAVTTGNSYTVAIALDGVRYATDFMGIDLQTANVMILGATGSIGSVSARILAKEGIKNMTLVARNERRLERLAENIMAESGLAVRIETDVDKACRSADVIIAVSSAVQSLIKAESLRVGAVVCDVARPRSVAAEVATKRDDVFVFEGSIVEPPGDVEFNLDFGFPPKTCYACMAETMILTLEKRFESYSLGRRLRIDKVEEVAQLGKKHGFKLAGLRNFDRSLTKEDMESIRRNAKRRKALEDQA